MAAPPTRPMELIIKDMGDRRSCVDAVRELAELIYGDGVDEGVKVRGNEAYRLGALAPLVKILHEGPSEAMSDATVVLSNITTDETLTGPVFEAGVVPPLISILKNGPEYVKPGAANIIRNLGFLGPMKRRVYSTGVMDALVDILENGCDYEDEYAREYAMSAILNLANHTENAPELLEYLPRIISAAHTYGPNEEDYKANIWTRFLGIVYNLSAQLDTADRTRMREAGIVEIVKPSFEHRDDPRSFVVANLCVANLLGHLENHPLLKMDETVIEELLRVLRTSMKGEQYHEVTWDLWAPLQGLANLSLNESNKRLILESDAITPIVEVMKTTGDPRALEYACKVISNLSFAADLGDTPDLVPTLQKIVDRGKGNKSALEYAKLSLFQIHQKRKGPRSGSQQSSPTKGGEIKVAKKHVMLSYPWKYQELFVWIKDYLQNEGFAVWMDIDQMSASVLESMAAAVEASTCVIFCMSSAYKESEACRTEGEYAYKLRKPLIPVKPDDEYQPDGWLGALAGNRLYFELGDPEAREEKMKQIVLELERHGAQRGGVPEEPKQEVTASAELLKARVRSEQAEAAVKDLQRQVQILKSAKGNADLESRIDQLEGLVSQLTADVSAQGERLHRVERSKACTLL